MEIDPLEFLIEPCLEKISGTLLFCFTIKDYKMWSFDNTEDVKHGVNGKRPLERGKYLEGEILT